LVAVRRLDEMRLRSASHFADQAGGGNRHKDECCGVFW
jgi:hypothetical protein